MLGPHLHQGSGLLPQPHTPCPPATSRPRRTLSSHVTAAFGRGGGGDKPSSSDIKLSTSSGLPSVQTVQQQQAQTVNPSPPPPPSKASGPPMPLLAVGGAALITAAAFLVKKMRADSAESMYGIETSSSSQGGRTRDMFGSLIKKNMNTTTLPELSEEMVAAARARRQKERANHKLSLEDVELPENHPWAIKAQVSPEEDEAVRARLRVRRRVARPSMQQADNNADGNRGSGKRIVRRGATPSPSAEPSM